jgi:hypothetical protein
VFPSLKGEYKFYKLPDYWSTASATSKGICRCSNQKHATSDDVSDTRWHA